MEAPQTSTLWRIGFMTNEGRGSNFDGLRSGFAGLGYAEGRHIVFEPRFAEHQLDPHLSFAADLVRLDVDLILTFGGPATWKRRFSENHEAPEPVSFRGLPLVAGAGYAECYTAPQTYWVDLRP